MESIAIKTLLQLGGGYVLAAIAFVLFFLERRRHKELQESKDKLYDKLFTMSENQTRVITEVNSVLKENDRTLDNVTNTMKMISSGGRRG